MIDERIEKRNQRFLKPCIILLTKLEMFFQREITTP